MIHYPQLVLLFKNNEHHLERHYEIETKKSYFLQYVYVKDEFYKTRFSQCLNLNESFELKNLLLEEYGSHVAYDDFMYLQEKTFTSFFREHSIDVPRCFTRSLSVKRSVNEINLLKLSNYLMRNGNRAGMVKSLLSASNQEFNNPTTLLNRTKQATYSWKTLFMLLHFATKRHSKVHTLPLVSKENIMYNHMLFPTHKLILPVWDFSTWFFKYMYDNLPIFSFYIYKVDKKIFKNTRGKSGKFTFIWKYVTPYKRLFLVMHWLTKELRIRPGRDLNERLVSLIHDITYMPKKTWAHKVKKFSHNYVYRNARYSLAEHYRTVTK